MKQFLIGLVTIFTFFITFSPAFAQQSQVDDIFKEVKPPAPIEEFGGTGTRGATKIQFAIDQAVKVLYSIAGVAFVIMIIWGGLDWVLSGGNKEKIESGRKKITWAIIGFVIMALAFLIANFVGGVVGLSPFKTPPIIKP